MFWKHQKCTSTSLKLCLLDCPSYNYRQISKPQHKTVLQWTEDSVETLRGCFSSTDWYIFHNLDLNEATETVTHYIQFFVDNVVSQKDILHFPNKNSHIIMEVKACINKKKLDFKNKDRLGAAAVHIAKEG